ncbi:NADH-ubiquinone oxidoreductase-F iron-sulfur binding region domain-containing protein [Pusillimonas sp.]|uniref:NADH-ubiquinone oxidoreductase-F iron-sulfur binding region domain-containing protein n=1 Tax=Pusillimonas sp. TaxID=3040095 RepID=UPI0037C9A80F
MHNIFDKSLLLELAARCGLHDKSAPAYAHAQAMGADSLLEQIQEARLDGKGGARFPAHKKMRMLRSRQAPIKHLIINGAEHEPGSFKDDWLQTHHADAVVEGALCMALAVGATHVHFGINETSRDALGAMTKAVEGIGKAHEQPPVLRVHPISDVYVAGEETALIQALQGMEPMPTGRPPFPVERGLDGAPTLVHNAETAAHVPYIVLAGAQAYRELGCSGLGPTLCTFGPEFIHDGVQLVPLGISLNKLVDKYGGGLRSGEHLLAIQPGGPSSAYLPAGELDCAFDADALKARGSSLGCAAIRAYSNAGDLIAAVQELADFFATASCGQCPPCTMQTRMMTTIAKQVAAGKASPQLIDQIARIAQVNADKGLCGLINMPVPPVQSLLQRFPQVLGGDPTS